MNESLNSMTLREKLTETDRLMRELSDHWDNGLVPQTRQLSRSLQEHGNNVQSLSDMAVRQQAADIINSNRFAERLAGKVDALLRGIDADVCEILGES